MHIFFVEENPCLHIKAASKMIHELCGEFGSGIDQDVHSSEVVSKSSLHPPIIQPDFGEGETLVLT